MIIQSKGFQAVYINLWNKVTRPNEIFIRKNSRIKLNIKTQVELLNHWQAAESLHKLEPFDNITLFLKWTIKDCKEMEAKSW